MIDIAEFVSDYVQMLRDCGEPIPPRKQLAEEIAEALHDRTDAFPDEATLELYATPEQIDYYL